MRSSTAGNRSQRALHLSRTLVISALHEFSSTDTERAAGAGVERSCGPDGPLGRHLAEPVLAALAGDLSTTASRREPGGHEPRLARGQSADAISRRRQRPDYGHLRAASQAGEFRVFLQGTTSVRTPLSCWLPSLACERSFQRL